MTDTVPKGPIQTLVEERLTTAFTPTLLEVKNQSQAHKGHMHNGDQDESHFKVTIVSNAFEGASRVERQRQVHTALGDAMPQIHALSLRIFTPPEYAALNA